MTIYVPGKLTFRKQFQVQDYMWEFPQQYGLWTPAQISTVLWLDASDASTITTVSGGVSEWRDKSGNNRHVTQALAANQPTFTANSLNGKSSVTFSDKEKWLLGALGDESTFDYTSSAYVFFVGQIAATGNNVVVNKGRVTFGAVGWYLDVATTDQVLVGLTSPGSFSTVGTSTPLSNDTDVILSLEANGSTVRGRFNGETKSTTPGGKASWIAGTNDESLLIGAYTTGSASSNFQGVMRQIIVMPSPPSLADVERLEGWAAHFYGLTANLPANHPYKTTPPLIP